MARAVLGELGAEIAPGLHEAELDYLRQHEWATCADDVLWRRSKLGLHCTPLERQAVADWFERIDGDTAPASLVASQSSFG